MGEQWLPVPGFERFYDVSNQGGVRSWHSGEARPLKQQIGTHGYPQVNLSMGGRAYLRTVHALVAAAFLGKRPKGMYVCHADGDPGNAALTNLRYDTPSANVADRERHGTLRRPLKTHCKRGHSLEDAYVEIRPSRAPGRTNRVRICRSCTREDNRAAYLRRKD